MAQSRYSGYTPTFVHGGGTLSLTQQRGVTINNGKQLLEVQTSGDLDRKAVCLSHADPEVMIRSGDLATILGTVSPTTGLKLTGVSTFRYQLRDAGGTFVGSTTDRLITNTPDTSKSFLAMESISANQDDQNDGAVCELKMYPCWGGDLSVPPLVPSTDSAIGGSAPAFTSQFFLGPVYLGSTQLEGLRSSRVEFGIGFVRKRADGDPWARAGSIYTRRPVITLNFEKLPVLINSAMFSAALAETLAVYYWKGVHGGTWLYAAARTLPAQDRAVARP